MVKRPISWLRLIQAVLGDFFIEMLAIRVFLVIGRGSSFGEERVLRKSGLLVVMLFAVP